MNPLLVIGLSFATFALLRIAFEQKNKKVPGTDFSMKHLESIFPEIIFYPIEEQAKYADHICQHMVSEANLGSITDRNEIESSISEALCVADYSQWNATSVGNIAYITLNSKYEPIRSAGKIILDNSKQYFNNKKAAA